MRKNSNDDFGRQATALLASIFVIVGGLLSCASIAMVFADRPSIPLTLCGLYLITILLLLWVGRERPRNAIDSGGVFQFLRRRRNDGDAALRYEPMRRRRHRPSIIGINEPPSVESVRELGDGMRNWAPSERNLKK